MISGEIIGDIHINVCKSQSGNTFYYLEATNKEVLSELDYLEKSLQEYQQTKK